MRCQGMSLMRLPLSVWAWFITSCIGLTAFAVLMPACILLILDHVAGTSFFVPSNLVVNDQLQPHAGGSTLLWQHLFWFFGHPEVYIAIVPAMGVVSHVLITNMRRPLLSHRVIIYSMVAIAFLSYMVYGHHMFVSGMNPFSSIAFSFPTLAITIPATIIVLIWIGSLYGSKLRINTASLFALGFISMFVSGGISGFFLAQPSIDIMLHATYFVVGHFHLVMAVAALFGIFAGTYFWFPKVTGKDDERDSGQDSFLVYVRRRLLHLHAVSLSGHGRKRSPLSGFRRRLHGAADAGAQVHHHRCADHGSGATALPVQPDPQPLLGQAGAGESVGGHVVGVVDPVAAAVRQFRRQVPGCVSRSVPVRHRRCDQRLCDAGFAGAINSVRDEK